MGWGHEGGRSLAAIKHIQLLPSHRGAGSGSRYGSPEMAIQQGFARIGPREFGRHEVQRDCVLQHITSREGSCSGLVLPSPGEDGRSRKALGLERWLGVKRD